MNAYQNIQTPPPFSLIVNYIYMKIILFRANRMLANTSMYTQLDQEMERIPQCCVWGNGWYAIGIRAVERQDGVMKRSRRWKEVSVALVFDSIRTKEVLCCEIKKKRMTSVSITSFIWLSSPSTPRSLVSFRNSGSWEDLDGKMGRVPKKRVKREKSWINAERIIWWEAKSLPVKADGTRNHDGKDSDSD